MNFGKYHQDVMDNSRVVVPRSTVDNGALLCDVYFKSKNNRLDFAGKTKIPSSLFTGTKYDPGMPDRIGFVLSNG